MSRLRTTLRPDEAAIDHLEGTLENAVLTAEGTIGLNTPGNLRLNVRLAGARLEQWLPEDWLKRCSGVASAKATVRGNWRLPETVQATGDFQVKDAMLQALPLLDIISKKTQNASFLRMQIKEAAGRFERRQADDWQIRQLRADAPGLLMDALALSRHHRCFPGQGDLPVDAFIEACLATGYRGPVSLEIFNDQFRGALPAQIALDGMRALEACAERIAKTGHTPDIERLPVDLRLVFADNLRIIANEPLSTDGKAAQPFRFWDSRFLQQGQAASACAYKYKFGAVHPDLSCGQVLDVHFPARAMTFQTDHAMSCGDTATFLLT